MIDLELVKKEFNNYIDTYENKTDSSFQLKITHTMHVVENAKNICEKMKLSREDIELAQLIAYLHDIGRFEELKVLKGFDSVRNNHALYGSEVLFDKGLIRKFIIDNSYDNIIKKAIENHNKLAIEEGLNERELLHSRIIRDADKLDNFRVNIEETIETRFSSRYKSEDEFNNSIISDNVYKALLEHRCVDIHDRVYPLDYWLCVMAFIFDLSFKESFIIVKENDYINKLIDKFNYYNQDIKIKMEEIRIILNNYIEERI